MDFLRSSYFSERTSECKRGEFADQSANTVSVHPLRC